MIETIDYDGSKYPAFQASGNAARFIMPFAKEFCKGRGLDIGCGKLEWAMPGAIPIDPKLSSEDIRSRMEEDAFILQRDEDEVDAMNLPAFTIPNGIGNKHTLITMFDFIFSSHCLEHIDTPWFKVLEYWKSRIVDGGVIFLYLPDYSQEYWRPWNNRKHLHVFTPEVMKDAFESLGMKKIFVSGVDMNNSFAIVGEV